MPAYAKHPGWYDDLGSRDPPPLKRGVNRGVLRGWHEFWGSGGAHRVFDHEGCRDLEDAPANSVEWATNAAKNTTPSNLGSVCEFVYEEDGDED